MNIINKIKNKLDFDKLEELFKINNFWDIFKLSTLKLILIYITTLKTSDYNLSVGLSIGVFSSFFPIGTQAIIAIILAKLLHGNYILALVISLIHNPLTAAFFFKITNDYGNKVLCNIFNSFENLEDDNWFKKIYKNLICVFSGAFVLGLIFGSLTFLTSLSYLKIVKLIKNLDLKYNF